MTKNKNKRVKTTRAKALLFYRVGRRDGFWCNTCGISSKDLQLDHIKPVSENGSNKAINLQILCPKCHLKKTQEDLRAAKIERFLEVTAKEIIVERLIK